MLYYICIFINIFCRYYQPFFDIETTDVSKRIFYSLLPIKTNFLEIIQDNPDLYGPFWIYTSLIFAIAASGNISQYLKSNVRINIRDIEL